ncbi:MAG: WD40 repeat domain-containing protein, partial [Acidobacteria bacterium]|nr:WD40 repeat domain-containing protein [Acidobacteriota bacterium]
MRRGIMLLLLLACAACGALAWAAAASAYQARITGLAVSPDGRTFAAGYERGGLALYDFATRKRVRDFKGHTKDVRGLAFSPDRKVYALGDTDKNVALRDTETRKRLQTLQGHAGQISAVAFSPDGKMLATASGAEDDPVRLWDAATGKELRALRWAKKGGAKGEGRAVVIRVTSLDFSPDGKLLAAAGNVVTYPRAEPHKTDREYAGTVHLWDVGAGTVARTLTAGTTDIGHASFSPDGKLVVSGSGDDDRAKAGVKVWDAATAKLVRTLAKSYEYHDAVSVRVSPDGRFVAAADTQSGALWDLNMGEMLR